jgi:hypothetical protein
VSNATFIDPPFVPDGILKRLKELPSNLVIGALWAMAIKLSSHEGATRVVADEIKAVRDYQDFVASGLNAFELAAVEAAAA